MSPRIHRSSRRIRWSAVLLLLVGCGPEFEQAPSEGVAGAEGEPGVHFAAIGERGTLLTSVVWGGKAVNVNQAYGEYADYAYAAEVCMNYGQHPGIDIGVPKYTPIFAVEGGRVIKMGCSEFFRPNPVHILADSGEEHIYGHLWSNEVTLNQRVERGDLLGLSGEQTQKSPACSMVPDTTGPHLHFERKQGRCSIDPVPLLIRGSTTTPPPTPYAVDDKIQVSEGPLNVRSQPGTSAGVVTSLQTGTQMCVTGSSRSQDGYTWYPINTNGTTGWVAANFVGLVKAGGCASTPPSGPTPIPTSGWVTGDVLVTNDVGVRLRSSPSASGAIVHDGMPTGTPGVLVAGPVSADGYTWYQWDTRYGRGWSASTWMVETSSFTNRIANPTANANATSISATQTSTTLTRTLVNGDYAMRVANAGSQAAEGIRYDSATLSLTGARTFSGVVDVYGSGSLDGLRLRLDYTDGTYALGAASTVTLSSGAWKRVVLPLVVSSSTKTLRGVSVFATRGSATAMTYWVDNAKAVEL